LKIYKNKTVTETTTPTERSRLLDSLLAQNAYIVLRPSYLIEIKEPVFKLDKLIIDEKNKLLKNISIGKKTKDLFSTTENNKTIEIYSKDNTLLYSTSKTNNINLTTGQYLTFRKINRVKETYKISVEGDVDGDGKISPVD
jgi:hypothetical protein